MFLPAVAAALHALRKLHPLLVAAWTKLRDFEDLNRQSQAMQKAVAVGAEDASMCQRLERLKAGAEAEAEKLEVILEEAEHGRLEAEARRDREALKGKAVGLELKQALTALRPFNKQLGNANTRLREVNWPQWAKLVLTARAAPNTPMLQLQPRPTPQAAAALVVPLLE